MLTCRLRNDETVSITCIAFHLIKKDTILFADKEGYIGSFDGVLSADKSAGNLTTDDHLMEVSIQKSALIMCTRIVQFQYVVGHERM